MRFKITMMALLVALVAVGCGKDEGKPVSAEPTPTGENDATPTGPVATPMDPISASKWTEGKTAAGAIATSLKLYFAMQQGQGTYGPNLPSMSDMNMSPAELTGVNFDSTNYSWVAAMDEDTGKLTYAITVTRPAGLGGPLAVTLDQSGKWTP